MKFLSSLILLIVFLPGLATSAKLYGDIHYVKYISTISVNSILVSIPGQHPLIGDNIEVLIKGIAVPKKTGVCKKERELAVEAEKLINFLLARSKKISLKNIERGRRFRLVATVLADGKDIRQILIKKRAAINNISNSKTIDWCK